VLAHTSPAFFLAMLAFRRELSVVGPMLVQP
jgi:hypothetical protein